VNHDDVNHLATQLAGEAAAPLIHEAAARLELPTLIVEVPSF
jgi:hypothetical protein